MSGWPLFGIIVACIIVLGCAIGLVVFLLMKNKKKQHSGVVRDL